MGLRINNNRSSLTALRTLGNTDRKQATTLERLSTGLRINRASDDPSGLVISEVLRGQIGSLQKTIENSTNASNVVATAEGALDEMNALLVGLRESVIFALNTGSSSPEQIAAEQDSVDQAIAAIQRIADSTKFGTRRLLNGNSSFTISDVDQRGLLRVIPQAVQLDHTSATGTTRFDVGVTQYAKQATHVVIDPLSQVVAVGAAADQFSMVFRSTDTTPAVPVNTDTAITFTLDAAGQLTYRDFMNQVNQQAATSRILAQPDGRLYSQTLSSGAANDEAVQILTFTQTVGTPTVLIGQTVLDNAADVPLLQTAPADERKPSYLTIVDPMITQASLASAAPGVTAFPVSGRQVVTGGDITLRIRGNLGVQEVNLQNGTTYAQFADAVNLLRGNTGVYASDNGQLYSETFGETAQVNLEVIDGNGTYEGGGGLTYGASTIVSYGTDAETTLAGSKAFARGNNLQVVSTIFNGQIELNNPAYTTKGAPPANLLSDSVLTGTVGQTVTFTVSDGTTTSAGITLTVGATDTYRDFMNQVNAAALAAGVNVMATNDGRLESTGFGSSQQVTVNVTASTGSELKLFAESTNKQLSFGENAQTATGTAGNRAEMRVIDPASQTFSFKISNNSGLLFQLGTEASPNEQRLIGLPNMTTTFLGVPEITLGDLSPVLRGGGLNSLLSGAENDLAGLQENSGNALYIVDAAISVVSDARAFMGSFVHDTLDPNIRNTEVAVENLKASESDIRDLDFAQEIAMLSRQQVLFQSGISVLAQANAIPQSVLQLLKQ